MKQTRYQQHLMPGYPFKYLLHRPSHQIQIILSANTLYTLKSQKQALLFPDQFWYTNQCYKCNSKSRHRKTFKLKFSNASPLIPDCLYQRNDKANQAEYEHGNIDYIWNITNKPVNTSNNNIDDKGRPKQISFPHTDITPCNMIVYVRFYCIICYSSFQYIMDIKVDSMTAWHTYIRLLQNVKSWVNLFLWYNVKQCVQRERWKWVWRQLPSVITPTGRELPIRKSLVWRKF